MFTMMNAERLMVGGHGYMRDWGMEQLVRDVRIAQIYEGTNGVQAIELVGRKLPMAGAADIAAGSGSGHQHCGW